jgi:hypothetical protein
MYVSAILCEWMMYRAANPFEKNISFDQAERWFLGEDTGTVQGLVLGTNWFGDEYVQVLEGLSFDGKFVDLMPYILSWFDIFTMDGNVPVKKDLRTMKRKSGVAYTPSDVADFIVSQTLQWHIEKATSPSKEALRVGVLDVACGTGVFLRSALNILRNTVADTFGIWDIIANLYGMDINPQCIQSCAFVLTTECLVDLKRERISPWRLWQAVRGNLAVVDSTLVYRDVVGAHPIMGISKLRNDIRRELLGLQKPSLLFSSRLEESNKNGWDHTTCQLITNNNLTGSRSLSEIFPERGVGFHIVVGNPPYSRLPWDSHVGTRAANFKSAPSSKKETASSYYPLFVEMMWGLTKSDSASAGLVTPLSIAYNSSETVKQLRVAIESTPGTWRFAFFDRTPDSLFGDDVKTRNAIVTWNRDRGTETSTILTGPLLRWNSRNRKDLFKQVHYVPVTDISIRKFIPKLGNPLETTMYRSTQDFVKRSYLVILKSGAIQNEHEKNDPRLLFYRSVAYNWIPVFRFISYFDGENGERSSLKFIEFKDEREAWFFFACFVSRLTYWLWRVEGDGFHVTKDFVSSLPFHPSLFSEDEVTNLVLLARTMWGRMQQHSVVSVNKGIRTVSYYPYSCREELDGIDRILMRSLGLGENAGFLKKFVRDNIIAGRDIELRGNAALRRLHDEEELG